MIKFASFTITVVALIGLKAQARVNVAVSENNIANVAALCDSDNGALSFHADGWKSSLSLRHFGDCSNFGVEADVTNTGTYWGAILNFLVFDTNRVVMFSGNQDSAKLVFNVDVETEKSQTAVTVNKSAGFRTTLSNDKKLYVASFAIISWGANIASPENAFISNLSAQCSEELGKLIPRYIDNGWQQTAAIVSKYLSTNQNRCSSDGQITFSNAKN